MVGEAHQQLGIDGGQVSMKEAGWLVENYGAKGNHLWIRKCRSAYSFKVAIPWLQMHCDKHICYESLGMIMVDKNLV